MDAETDNAMETNNAALIVTLAGRMLKLIPESRPNKIR